MNHAMRFNSVCARQITGICSIFNAQKGFSLFFFTLHSSLMCG